MATQEDILEPICETTKQGGEAKDQVANILLNKLPYEEKTQTDQVHKLPETLGSFAPTHVKDNKNSEQAFEGEQILGSPSIREASCDAYTVPPGEILKVNCKTADPRVIHTEKTEEITVEAVEQKQEGLECVSKVVSNEEARESHAVKASFNNDTDATSAVIYEPKIENKDLTKTGLTGDIQCKGNTLLGLEAEAAKYVDTKVTTSSQSKEPVISPRVRNLIVDPQQILGEKIVDVVKAETFENVEANVCNEEPENNPPIQVDEHYQKKSENPFLSENAEYTLLEEQPSESTHVASDDIKAFTLSHTSETNDYFEDQKLNENLTEILDDKTKVKPIGEGEASIKEGTPEVQILATIASNEDVIESEKAPLYEHSTGLAHADLSETSREVKIKDEKIREDEQFSSEKNLASPQLNTAASGQALDAPCSFKDKCPTENPQETSSGKEEERTANLIDKKEETLDIQNASISDEKESLIGMDDSEKKPEELLVEAKIENAEPRKPMLHESPMLKIKSQTEKCAESIQIAPDSPLASDSTQSMGTASCVKEKGLIADSQEIVHDKIEDKTTDGVETEQSVEQDTAVLSNEESKEKFLTQVDGSQPKNEENSEMEAEKPCLLETSTIDINSNKHSLEIGNEDLNKVELLVNEGNQECNLVKEEAAEEKLVKSFHMAKEEYKVSNQDREIANEGRHEKPEECLQVSPQDDKILIQKTEEARNIAGEKILSLCLESDKEKAEVVEVVESLHVAHEDDKPLNSDVEVDKERKEDMVAHSLNTAKDDIGLSQPNEVAKEAAEEENLVETLDVAYVTGNALNPDLEEVNEVAYEENFLLVDPEKSKSSSQDGLAKEENIAETSYVGLKREQLEAEHEKLVELSDAVLEHDKALVDDTEVTKKQMDVEHVAESKALPGKAPIQKTEATKKETEQKNDTMSSQGEKATGEQNLEEILYVASEAHKSLCPEAEVGKREATAESLNVVFEAYGNQKTKVAEEGKAVAPLHVTHEDAKVLSQEAQPSITEIEEAKHVESLNPAEFLNIVFEGDGSQSSKVARKEKSIESLHVAHEDTKALSQDAEVPIKQTEEAKPVESLKQAEFLSVVFEEDGNQRSKVAEEEKSVESLLLAHKDAKALSQEAAEVSIRELEEAKHVECLKPTEFLNIVSEDGGNQRSKVAEEEAAVESYHVAHEDAKALIQEAEVSVTQIEEAKSGEYLKPAEFLNIVFEDGGNQSKFAEEEKSVESLCVAHEDAKASSQEAEVSVTQIEEAKSVASFNIPHKDDDEVYQDANIGKVEVKEDKSKSPFYVNEERSQDYSTKEDHKHTLGSNEVSTHQTTEANKVIDDPGKTVKDIELHLTAYSEPLCHDTEVAIEEIEIDEVKLGESLHVPFEDNKKLCLDNQVAKGVEHKVAESFHIAKEGEKIVEPSCVAPEDDKEIRTDISTRDPHRTVESHEGADYQSKDTSDEVQKNHELIVGDKDIDLEMEANLHVTPNAEPLSQDKEAEIEEVEVVKPVASLHEPSEDGKELCLGNQVVQEEAKDKLVESAPEDENASRQDIKEATEEQKCAESLCLAIEDDREVNTSVSTQEPQNDALGSHETGKDQGKETIDEKDLETVIEDKNIASQMTDILPSQDRGVVMEDIKIEETKDVESLHETSQNDEEQCPDNQAAKDATKDQHSESIIVAHVDEQVLNEDTKVPKEEGEKSIEPLCVAEDEKEIITDISIKDPHTSRLGLSEAVEDQIKETKDEVKKDPEIIVKEGSDLPKKDRLQDVPDSETPSQDREMVMEKVEEVKPIESLCVSSEDDKTLCVDNQVAENKKEPENKLVESFHELAKQEGEKSTDSSCVAPDDDKEVSADISEKEVCTNILDSDEAAEDQNKEIDEEEQKDPESTVKSKDIDLKMTDNLDNITLCSEPSSQDLQAAKEVEELNPVASLHVSSEDDKQMCLDNQVAKEEIDHKIVESFLLDHVDKNASNEDASVSKGEKLVEPSCVALGDDKELSADISIEKPHGTTLESHEAAEEQSKETNVKVKDCEIMVKDKDIDLKMIDNLQRATSYSQPLSQDQVLTIEEEEVKPLDSLHVPREDDKTSCLEIQAAVKYVGDKESFHVAIEDKRASNKDAGVSNEGEKDDKETSTYISIREPLDNALGSYDATEYQIKETNDKKDLETVVAERDINLQMKDNVLHVTPYSESLSQEQEVAMAEINETKLVKSLHIPSEDDKEICLENQVMKEEGKNKLVESFDVAPVEQKASNQDSEVAKENEKFIESSCVAPEDIEILEDIPRNKLGSCEALENQSKETNDEVQKVPETIVKNKDIEFQLTDHATSQGRDILTGEVERVMLVQDRDTLTDDVEKVMLVESLHEPREDDKEVCTNNEIAKQHEAEDELVEPFHVAFDGKTSIQDTVVSIERENVAESSCPALEDDKEISTDTTVREPHNSKLSSDEAAENQIKETNDEVQKDPETTAMDKDIKLVKDNSQNVIPNAESLGQEQEVATEEEEEEKVMPVESLHLPSDDDKELCPENVDKEEKEEDKLGQSFDLALDDVKESNPDSIASNKAGEESGESSCIAVEDSKEKSQDILTVDPHNTIFVSREEAKEQSKEANEKVEDNYSSMVLDKHMELQLRDDRHGIPSPEAENQVAGDAKEAENKLVESFHATPTIERTSNQDKEVAKQEKDKSTESSCVAAEDDKETSRDISEKEDNINILNSDELAEDQKTEIDAEEQKDPESTAKSKDIDVKMTDNQDNITLCSEPSSQDLEAAIEVDELKLVASLQVPSEDDKEMCPDNQVAKEEIHDKSAKSFLVTPEDKNTSHGDASVAKGEKLVEPSCVALDDDKELSPDISIEPHRTTLESFEAAEEQSKETNDEVDCQIAVKDKDINLKMTDNLQSATSYSESLSQDPVLTMEEVQEVKPLESLHVPPEDDQTSYLEIQAAAKYAEDKIVESFHVAPEDKRTSNIEVSNVGEKDDNETRTGISTTEPHDDALGSYDATEYKIKQTNDEKDLETVVEGKNIDMQMKDNLQHVTPYSESSSQEQEVTMEEIEETKLVESLHIPSEDDKEICLGNQVMKEEGENKLVESLHVAHVEQKASNKDSEVAREKEKFVESSCVAPEGKEIMVDIPHNKLGSCEPPENQSKETNDEVQEDPETIVRNKDIEFHLIDHVTSQDRDILTDEVQRVMLVQDRDILTNEVEKVMLAESLHEPREDDKEVCKNDEIDKQHEAEVKLVEPFHVDFDGKTSIQDTVVSIERENVAESSCPALEDDKEISTDTTVKEPHSKLSSDEAAKDQIKETNDKVQKDPETTAMDKDIKLLVKDNSQNITSKAESLSQEQEVATDEEKVMPVESLHLPSDDDKELCPENVAKEEQEEDKLGQSFNDEKESNPDSTAVNKAGEESYESSCVAVEDSKEKSQDISTIDPHNKIFVSREEAKEQSKEANEEVEDNYGSMVSDKDIELQLRDGQHAIASPEALSQDTEALTEEIESKPRECLTELSGDGKESCLDKGEEKLAGSFYVAPEDDKASRQEMKEVSEQGEEEKPTGLSHIAFEDCRTLNQEINDEVHEDPETTANYTNIDLQMTDNRRITPYSETATDDEAHGSKEIKEFEGKSPDGNIEKDFNEEEIEEKPAINILVQEETCQKFDVTDNSKQVVSAYSDEKNNFLVPCIEDEKESTELDVEVPEKIGSADGNVKTTKINEEKGYLQDLQTITAVNIATHEEKAIELENVIRPETENSYVSHEQVGLSVVEVSEEQPHMIHEKIEEPHVSHAKNEDVTSVMLGIPKEKADHTSTGKISCNEETESEEMELFGDELCRIAANKSLEEVDSKNEERELEMTTKPVEEEDQTDTVKVINASLEEEERSQDFSKPIMDNPKSILVDLKDNEQGGEKIACIQEIGTVSETKVDDNKFKTEEMAKEFLQKPFIEPANFEEHLTAEKDLTEDGDIEKEASEKEAGEQKISCGSSNTPSMIEGRGTDLATSANEAVDENTNYKIAGHEKTSHEITGIMEATVTANETSLRGYLINDNSKCEIESSHKVPETTRMTTSTESQAIESLRVEEAPAFEFLPARAESEETNIGCLATPKLKKISDDTESCVGENEARLGLKEEIPKEEENSTKENVESISEKEVVPTPLEGVPESLTQVQDCDVISKSEYIEINEEMSGIAKMGTKSEGVVLEEAFEPKETTYEEKETGEANMSAEKMKDEDEDNKDDYTGSYKEEITREIQTENKVDRDVQEVCEVIEPAKGNIEVSKVFEDPNDTQKLSTHVACNENAVAELGRNLQSIDVSLNQTAHGKSITEVSTLLDTEEVVHDLERSRSECERSIEKAESSAIEFEDKRSAADDFDNAMIKESKMSAADAAKAELPGKPDIGTVSEPATKPSYGTLEHYEDNRGYLNPIMRTQPEDSGCKQLVPGFSQEKESEKWDAKNEITTLDKVELDKNPLTLLSEKTDEKTSITDNWNIISGNNDGKPCIEAEKLDLSTDKQVSPQADHIEKILAPEKDKSTRDSESYKVEKEESNFGNEEQKIKEVTKSMKEPETEDVHKSSLKDIHQVSTKAIGPIADCSTGEEPTMSKEELYEEKPNETKHEESKAGEEHDEEEELCGQHKSDSSSDAPIMVDVGDADVKHTHKKSHNLLSGVGSKVKHSLAKVKKAIIGKPSHPKPPSPK